MAEPFDVLALPFVQRAVVASLGVALVCGLVSFFVVLRRIAFVGAGIAHVGFGGVALALAVGAPALLGALGLALAAALWIAAPRTRAAISDDTAIGIAFSSAMAAGVIAASLGQARGADLMTYLFGNVLTVTGADLVGIAVMAGLVLALLARWFRPLVLASFDPETARVQRLPVGRLDALLFGLIALTVVLSMRTVGLLLVSALLVVPGAVAQRVTRRLRPFLAVSVAVALGSCLGGLALSFALDLPSGASMVLVASAAYLAVALATTATPRSGSPGGP